MAVLLALMMMLFGATDALAQRIPAQSSRSSSIQGIVRDADGRPIPGAQVELRLRAASGRPVAIGGTRTTQASADGVFRFLAVAPGEYTITITHPQYQPRTTEVLRVTTGELVTTSLQLEPSKPLEPNPLEPLDPLEPLGASAVRPRADLAGEPFLPVEGERVFVRVPDRWNVIMPGWDRYGAGGDYPYVSGKWWDPYNQNVLKGDRAIIGQRTFFTFTGISDSLFEARHVPVPSGVSTAREHSENFYGDGGQAFPVTVVRTSFDLFRGDTVYRPVDWRIRVQPAFSLN